MCSSVLFHHPQSFQQGDTQSNRFNQGKFNLVSVYMVWPLRICMRSLYPKIRELNSQPNLFNKYYLA